MPIILQLCPNWGIVYIQMGQEAEIGFVQDIHPNFAGGGANAQ